MTVKTTHIQEMLSWALTLAKQVDNKDYSDRYVTSKLRRAINLANHAAAELEDELVTIFEYESLMES